MPNDDKLRTVTCPSCSAPLEMPAGQTTMRCRYCGATIERPADESTPSPQIQIVQLEPGVYAPPARRTSSSSVLLAVLLLLLAAGGGVAWLIWQQGGGLSNASLYISQSASLMVVGDNPTPDIIAFAYDASADNRLLVRLSGSQSKLLWRAAPFGQDVYDVPIIPGRSFIYTAAKTRLLALRPEDGAVAWETSLTDEVSTACEECLRLLDDRLLALTTDGTLQGFDAQSGKLVWSFRLHNVSNRLLVIAGRPAVFDSDDEGTALLMVNPANGKQVQRLAPTCGDGPAWASGPDTDSPLEFDESAHALYFLFGSYPACVQRWDTTSGSQSWSTEVPDESLASASDGGTLLNQGTLYFSQHGQLAAVDTQSGTVRQLVADEDYDLLPLAVQEDLLIVRARRSRGSSRFELWALDSDSGERRWQHPFENSEPMDQMSGLVDQEDAAWTWQLAGGALFLVQAQAEPNQLIVDTLNPQDGVSAGQKTIPLPRVTGDFYSVPSIIARKNDRLWMILDSRIYAVDLAAGTLAYTWP